ncbi:Aste57867_16196 [Aphanomyces stellatus]|uniref:mannan endo-1,4-beta-mannosidase n=1 Tax=Aphanomyces stellatus TaxID=120398 RepID=A0A485L5U7_9STRA|nr:hypothetical protein As57867_016140 [Aphanomyces stellatus]VFT92974.1 Aste57867_16196 [Aphanomyces stellatus]
MYYFAALKCIVFLDVWLCWFQQNCRPTLVIVQSLITASIIVLFSERVSQTKRSCAFSFAMPLHSPVFQQAIVSFDMKCIIVLAFGLAVLAHADWIDNWNTCRPGQDQCKSKNMWSCCVAPADATSGKTTCRPPGDCAPPIPDWQTCHQGQDTCASAGYVCCVAPADVGNGKTTCRPRGNECAPTTPNPSSPDGSPATNFAGANSFYIHNLAQNDRLEILDTFQRNGFRTVRIFLSEVGAGAKGTSNTGVRDLESAAVGHFDDTILDQVDQLMLECYQRKLKLVIALHDRYALGCWGTDAYVAKYGFPVSATCDVNVNRPNGFYTRADAQADFDRRLEHILTHKNPHFQNRVWGNIPEAVFGFEPQNESQGHMEDPQSGALPNPQWICRRATLMRQFISSQTILVMTGGGTDYTSSALVENFQCPAVDVVSIHTYDSANVNVLHEFMALARQHHKRLIVEEFGFQQNKASNLAQFTSVLHTLGLPWMVWQVLKPGNTGDYETWTNENEAWQALKSGAASANGDTNGAFAWPELGVRT